MTNDRTCKHTSDAPTWLAALLALVQTLFTAFFDNIVDPLANGARPSRRKLQRMAEQLVRSEAELMRAIHDAVRRHAGLAPNTDPRLTFRAPPRTSAEFAQRLYVHGKMLMDPKSCVMRILYRMFQDESRCASAAPKFDPTPNNPRHQPRGPERAAPHPPRTLELSG